MSESERAEPLDSDELTLTAYRVSHKPEMPLVPATHARDWIAQTSEGFARRCLPLMIANQAGWMILNSHSLVAVWNGSKDAAGLAVHHRGGSPPYPAVSHFGHGILSWHIPYLFHTPPGYNLLVRGPANWPRDGVSPLEGLVETDWTPATFTMNWQLTRPDFPVLFRAGEPICMIVPQRRGELEAFHPQTFDIHTVPEIAAANREWRAGRMRFLAELPVPGSDAHRAKWQKDYFRGRTLDGSPAPEHQTKLKLRLFEPRD
jgi:hypothetical protein